MKKKIATKTKVRDLKPKKNPKGGDSVTRVGDVTPKPRMMPPGTE